MTADAYRVNPGYINYVCPDGRCVTKAGKGSIQMGTSTVSVSTDSPKSGDVKPIEQKLVTIETLLQNLQDYDFVVDIGARISASSDYNPSKIAGYQAIANENRKMTYDLYNTITEDLSAAEAEGAAQARRNECIEKTIKKQKSFGSSFFSEVLSEITDFAIDEIQGLLNEQLPSWAQLNISTTADKNGVKSLSGISIGGVSYNSQKGTLTVGSRTYSGYLKQGLRALNKQLPSFARVSFSDLGISFGNIVIGFNNISRDKNNPTAVGTGSVYIQEQGIVLFEVGGEQFQVGQVLTDVATNTVSGFIDEGLDSINEALPDFLQIESELDFDPETGKFGGGISIGPVGISTNADGNLALSLDSGSLADTISDYVGGVIENAISQLPAPLNTLARIFWEALDFGGLLRDKLQEPKRVKDPAAINKTYSECLESRPAAPPLIEYETDTTTPSEILSDVIPSDIA